MTPVEKVAACLKRLGRVDTVAWLQDPAHSTTVYLLIEDDSPYRRTRVEFVQTRKEAEAFIAKHGDKAPRTRREMAQRDGVLQAADVIFAHGESGYARMLSDGKIALFRAMKDDEEGIQRDTRTQAQHKERAGRRPEIQAAVSRSLDAQLDLTAPSKTSRSVIRPPIPMMLSEVVAPRLRNPAPVIRKDKQTGYRPAHSNRGFGFGEARAIFRAAAGIKGHQYDDVPASEVDAVLGMAWEKSAKEGVLPIPRRGGKYDKHEASAIMEWLRNQWPIVRELTMQEKARAQRLRAAPINKGKGAYKTLDWLTQSGDFRPGGNDEVMRNVFWSDHGEYGKEAGSKREFEAPERDRLTGLTPKEAAALITRWVRVAAPKAHGLIHSSLYEPATYKAHTKEQDIDRQVDGWRAAFGQTYFYELQYTLLNRLYDIDRRDKVETPNPYHKGLMHSEGMPTVVLDGRMKASEAMAHKRGEKEAYAARNRKRAAKQESAWAPAKAALARYAKDRDFATIGAVRKHLPHGYTAVWEGTYTTYLAIEDKAGTRAYTGSTGSKTQMLQTLSNTVRKKT